MKWIMQRGWNQFVACRADVYTQGMQKLLHHLDARMLHPDQILKDDPTSTVVVFHLEGTSWVVKRSNTKGFWHQVRRLFSCSRARKNWYFSRRLQAIGIATADVVALREERFFCLQRRCYFVSRFLSGVDARQYFMQASIYQPHWTAAIRSIAAMLVVLAKHKMSHHDLNLSNIILINNKPWLIDLDGMRQHYFAWFAALGAKQDKQRFMQNWQENPDLSKELLLQFQSAFAD